MHVVLDNVIYLQQHAGIVEGLFKFVLLLS